MIELFGVEPSLTLTSWRQPCVGVSNQVRNITYREGIGCLSG